MLENNIFQQILIEHSNNVSKKPHFYQNIIHILK